MLAHRGGKAIKNVKRNKIKILTDEVMKRSNIVVEKYLEPIVYRILLQSVLRLVN